MDHEDAHLTDAAVLAPVFRGENGGITLVVVRRTDFGTHGGQLAFPGGKREPGDASLLATALREAHEEIGIDPAHVDVLARLPAVDTHVSGFRITPFLARIRPRRPWKTSEREIAEVIELPLVDLTRHGARGRGPYTLPDRPDPIFIDFFNVGAHRLWGATFRILEPLVPRLAAGEWEV